jgi:hypothetical protein
MAANKKPDRSRSDAFQHTAIIQEIMSKKPGFLVRWGNILLFIIVLIIGFLFWSIQYPETIHGSARLTQKVSATSQYVAEIAIPQSAIDHVKKGQRVLLQFHSYPAEEFGLVPAAIDSINREPSAEGFIAKVVLAKRLRTTYNKEIPYTDGLLGTAEIFATDIRLLEKIYTDIRKRIKK